MAEPPRLRPILLPWDKSIIYFVTICVNDRRRVLANEIVSGAIRNTIRELRRWKVLLGVVMPDHVHFVVAPVDDRDLSVGDFATGFKRLLRKQLGPKAWWWQRGCFDRLLRSDESLGSKWIYVEDNSVRAGLVKRVEDWPYRFDFVNGDEDYSATKIRREASSFPCSAIARRGRRVMSEFLHLEIRMVVANPWVRVLSTPFSVGEAVSFPFFKSYRIQ